VRLTGHELELIPSVVAAIAIVGGYLGVSAANRTTLNVAEQERSSKREDELKALKRTVYVKVISALNALVAARVVANEMDRFKLFGVGPTKEARTQVQAESKDALMALQDAMLEMSLVTGNNDLLTLAHEADEAARRASSRSYKAYPQAVGKLAACMQLDLKGVEFPRPELREAAIRELLRSRPSGQMFVTIPDPPPVQPPDPKPWWRR
jgi:hypothetical protein